MTTVDPRVWLAADVPSEVAELFRARAREESRSGRAQLRHLLSEYVSMTSEAQAGNPGLREDTAGHRRDASG